MKQTNKQTSKHVKQARKNFSHEISQICKQPFDILISIVHF